MANELGRKVESFIAGEDLSGYQYYCVYLSADKTVMLCDGTSKIPCGILENKPKEGEAAAVVVHGRSPAKLGGTVTVAKGSGQLLMCNSAGKLVAAGVNWPAIASAEEGGSANEIRSVFVHRSATARPLSP